MKISIYLIFLLLINLDLFAQEEIHFDPVLDSLMTEKWTTLKLNLNADYNDILFLMEPNQAYIKHNDYIFVVSVTPSLSDDEVDFYLKKIHVGNIKFSLNGVTELRNILSDLTFQLMVEKKWKSKMIFNPSIEKDGIKFFFIEEILLKSYEELREKIPFSSLKE